MSLLQEHSLHCPYCGEPVTVLVDASVPEQRYIEDCEVCCRPMKIAVAVGPDGNAQVSASHEDQV